MIKLFDYKFLITLGLSLVVYFLYREVEVLNKRVTELEKKTTNNKPKKLIDLPPPPVEENNNIIEEYSNEENDENDNVENIENIESKENIEIKENVESNIYSHDTLETNTNEQDSLMVDSILNMVKPESEKSIKNESEKELEQHVSEEIISSENVPINQTESDKDVVLLNKISLEALNKKKLDELQELAVKNNIDINNQNGKKKKKSDLAFEIFNKLNL